VLYAFGGFEASCSLSSRIKDSKRNGPLAIFISYSFVVTIVFLYQLLFYGSLGTLLGTLAGGYLDAFPVYLQQFSLSPELKIKLQTLFHLAIASSTMGASYGILYSNGWNLYTLAHNNHTFKRKLFTSLNAQGMPYACILIEGFLALTYLLITQGKQVPLQQVSALGGTIAYTLSSIALLVLTYRNEKRISPIAIFSLLSCSLLILSFIWSIKTHGPTLMLMLFLGLIIFGSFMFYRKYIQHSRLDLFEEL
jgi:amino acid transporter